MPLLSEATLHVGASLVDRIYAGAAQVWPGTITHGRQIAANTALVGPAAGGFTSLTTITGDHTVSTPGATVSAKLITGALIIEADDVRVEGCRIIGGIRHNDVTLGDTGSVITYCDIGQDDSVTDPGPGMVINPGFRTLSYSSVHNGPDIAWLDGSLIAGPVVIEYNWLHTPEDPSDIDPHADVIQANASTNGGTIRGNFIDISLMFYNTTEANPPAGRRLTQIGNAGVIFGGNWHDGTITLSDNLMIGGSNTAQLYDTSSANNNFLVVTGNWFGSGTVEVTSGTETYPIYGPYAAGGTESARVTWSGNQNAVIVDGVWTATGTLAGP